MEFPVLTIVAYELQTRRKRFEDFFIESSSYIDAFESPEDHGSIVEPT